MKHPRNAWDSEVRAPRAVGDQVACWVNPDPPDQVVLERRISGLAWVLLGLIAVLLLAGVVPLPRR